MALTFEQHACFTVHCTLCSQIQF